MKKGCAILLLALVGAFAGYCYLLSGTELEHNYWAPGLLALGAALLVGNVHALVLAVRQKAVSGKSQAEWRDGDYVAISGQVRASGTPFNAPFSGLPSVMVEYDVLTGPEPGSSSTGSSDYTGFIMTPCSISSPRGTVKLVGFPLLAHVPKEVFAGDETTRRAAEYLSSHSFKEKSDNPLALIREINQVLADDDGTVQADFRSKKAKAHIVSSVSDGELDEELDDDGIPVKRSGNDPAGAHTRDAVVDSIAEGLRIMGYSYVETALRNGTEITAFGTYRRNHQALFIGSGLQNLSHSIQLGSVAAVTGKAIRRALIGVLFWGGAFAAGNWYVLNLIGIELKF